MGDAQDRARQVTYCLNSFEYWGVDGLGWVLFAGRVSPWQSCSPP